jgi:hypothetical protein
MDPVSNSPSTFRFVLGFLAVGIAWGFTTPFIRRAALSHSSKPKAQDASLSWLARTSLSLSYLLQTPSYTVPLLLNLSGSALFFLIVGQAGMSTSSSAARHVMASGVDELSFGQNRVEFNRANHKLPGLHFHRARRVGS